MLFGDRQMSVCPTPVADRRQRAGVTLLCRYLPHHVLTLPRLSPYVAEAEKGERCPIRVRVVLAIWSVAAEIDESRLVGVERELVPSETLAQNIQNPLGILEVLERHHGSSSGEESHLSALRTGRSRVIRLLPPNLRSHALSPQDKQLGVPSRDAPQPVHRRSFSAFEPLELPSRPLSEGLVEMPEHLNALRAIEPPVVVQPAPHHRVGEPRQILQALVVPGGRHPPVADGLAYRRGGLGADRRQETYEKLSPTGLCSARVERVPEEVELDILVRSPAVIIPAVDDLGLCWM